MAQIQVLDRHVAELIAAGEVVDRPASVVKELVENAVDAGATAITVEIQRGGVTFLRVTDDGCGIARDQVETALLRHATSKVRGADDLEQIATLGFRGEALASICAVSQFELFTRTEEELAGSHLINHGGTQVSLEEAGCAVGTTVLVQNLFFNTPARLKFLKTDAVEGSAVGAVVDNCALSHPEISFRFLKDGKEILHTPGDGKLKSAIYAVFGREFTMGLMPVEYTLDHVRVWGFVSKPSAARPNRRMQHFFINGRYVKSRTAMVAMEQAFKNSIMVGKFPSCVLHLELSCRAVDVNVHPTKLEVRFVNERPVFDAVYHAVKTALHQEDAPTVMTFPQEKKHTLTPEQPPAVQMQFRPSEKKVLSQPVNLEKKAPEPPVIQPKEPAPAQKSAAWEFLLSQKSGEKKQTSLNDSGRIDRRPVLKKMQEAAIEKKDSVLETAPKLQAKPEVLQSIEETKPEEGPKQETIEASVLSEPVQQKLVADEAQPVIIPETEAKPNLRFVGEVFRTYCIVERDDDTILFIDKHAAHERLLFEKLKAQTGESCAQVLLEPIVVTLSKEEYSLVLESRDSFAQAGFDLDDFGEGTILVRSAPLYLENGEIGDTVVEMAGYLCSHRTDLSTEHLDWLYHNIACRAAIKAGNHTTDEELMALIYRLEAEDVRYCPHGRPVSIVMRKKDLEKQFGRIQ